MSEFEQYAKALEAKGKAFAESITQEQQLDLYGLYKQATVGDINIPKPSSWSLSGWGKDAYKWDAWNKKAGISQDDAKEAYVALCQELGVTL